MVFQNTKPQKGFEPATLWLTTKCVTTRPSRLLFKKHTDRLTRYEHSKILSDKITPVIDK